MQRIITEEYEHLFTTTPGFTAATLHPASGRSAAPRAGSSSIRRIPVTPWDAISATKRHLERHPRDSSNRSSNHHFTLVCRDLADVGKYADGRQFAVPAAAGAYPRVRTRFLLEGVARDTTRRLKHERRGTIGLRVPNHPVTALLLTELGEPVMSSTLLLPGEDLPRTDAREINELLEHSVDMVLDGGNCGLNPTSVIDLSGDHAVVVRAGRGDVRPFEGPTSV